MKKAAALLIVITQIYKSSVMAQSTFQNLDFESANLSPVPAGQGGGMVPISEALPGWSASAGATPITQVLQNNNAGSSPSINILGPYYAGNSVGYILDGSYSVVLQPGYVGSLGSLEPVSIYQTGVVPSTAQSLRFNAAVNVVGPLAVTFNGQSLVFVPLSAGPNYEIYGANISTLAGQTGQLSFSEIPQPPDDPYPVAILDNILFSNQPIPEPSTWALLLCGAGLLGVGRLCKFKL